MSSGGSTRAILAALAANAGIAVAKFVGYLITHSSSMLAEAVHSVADTSNQALLLFGQRQSNKEADTLHPFGYGRSRFFYSFVVALVLFSLGSIFALYEGYEKIVHPHALNSPAVAIVILLVAVGLESYSFRTAMVESRPLKGNASWWRFIRNSRNPELPVVLLEDTGALIGLLFALLGVGLTVITGNPVWDGIGTVAIGVLLGVIAVILMVEMKSLLIGEGATPAEDAAIRRGLGGDREHRPADPHPDPVPRAGGDPGGREDRVSGQCRPGNRGRHHRRRRGAGACRRSGRPGDLHRARPRSLAVGLSATAAGPPQRQIVADCAPDEFR